MLNPTISHYNSIISPLNLTFCQIRSLQDFRQSELEFALRWARTSSNVTDFWRSKIQRPDLQVFFFIQRSYVPGSNWGDIHIYIYIIWLYMYIVWTYICICICICIYICILNIDIYVYMYHTVCMYIIYTYKLHECPKSFNSMNHNCTIFKAYETWYAKKTGTDKCK